MIKPKFFILIPVALVAFLLFSCESKKESKTVVESKSYIELPGPKEILQSWSGKDEVVVHYLSEPDNLHPTNGNSLNRSEIFLYIHGALLKTDLRTGKIAPYMAKKMPELSADQLSLTFELRDDIKWDDGSAVTADDVVFSIKAAKNPLTNNASMKSYFDFVQEVTADAANNKKFTIRMKSVYIQNVALWADYPIIQEAFYDKEKVLRGVSFTELGNPAFNVKQLKNGDALQQWSDQFNGPSYGFDLSLISGLGPYKVSQWQQGQLVVLEKKKNHWSDNSKEYSEHSNPQRIVFKVDKDPVTLELALMKQEFDVSTSMPTRTLLKLKEDSIFNQNYHGVFVDIYGYTFIGLNVRPSEKSRAACLGDKNVRNALSLLTPVENIISVVNKNVNKRVSSPVAYMKSSCNRSLKPVPFDVKAASALLDKSGWGQRDVDGVRWKMMDGKKVRLDVELLYMSVIPDWKEMGLLIAEGMSQAGVKLRLTGVDPGTWMEKGTSHDFDLIMGTWNTTALPEDYAQLWAQDSWKNNGLNFTGFGNDSTDALIQKISVTMDDHQRDSLEMKMQELIYEDYAYIFLYGLVRRSVVHKRFDGAELYAERPGVLYNVFRIPGLGAKSGVTP